YATNRARELFEAEGCALLLIDQDAGEFRFPIASQSATSSGTVQRRLKEVRFPITQGVAGWVHANGKAVVIAGAQDDERFFRGVDKMTGMTTRRMLAAPLRTSGGAIGVIEVINPRAIGDGDLVFLEALGSDVAIAHERAAFSAALRAEATGLR